MDAEGGGGQQKEESGKTSGPAIGSTGGPDNYSENGRQTPTFAAGGSESAKIRKLPWSDPTLAAKPSNKNKGASGVKNVKYADVGDDFCIAF